MKFWILTSLLMLSGQTFGSEQSMSGATIRSCIGDQCFTISAKDMGTSRLAPNLMVYTNATVTIVNLKKPGVVQTFEGTDGYYDNVSETLILRGLKNSKKKELVYDLSKNEIVYF